MCTSLSTLKYASTPNSLFPKHRRKDNLLHLVSISLTFAQAVAELARVVLLACLAAAAWACLLLASHQLHPRMTRSTKHIEIVADTPAAWESRS